MKYIDIYKCKRCNSIYSFNKILDDEVIEPFEIYNKTIMINPFPRWMVRENDHYTHECKKGEFGLAEKIGWNEL